VLTRAFHRGAALLVMDEPTVALDARAEHRVFTGLRELAENRAILLITHGLANVAVADRIVVLDQGRLAQEGTYAQLIREPGLFRSLRGLQQSGPNLSRMWSMVRSATRRDSRAVSRPVRPN
jgi:ATP-binding cassette subfamily B protein